MMTALPLLFLAGSPGPLELLVVFAVVLVLFGPRKLPEIARSIGRMLHELRKASDEFRSQVMSIDVPDDTAPSGTTCAPADETGCEIGHPDDMDSDITRGARS